MTNLASHVVATDPVSGPPAALPAATLPGEHRDPGPWTRPEIAGAIGIGAAAILVRALPVAASGLPLNDGGLFFAMVRDIQRAGMAWPAFTSYNGESIPFAYPPLALYVVAAVANLLPLSLLDLFRWIPLVFSCATVVVVYAIARDALPSRLHALVATAAFAVVPQGYEWVIEGGGVARAPGFLFALLAAWSALRWRRGGSRWAAAGALLTGAVALLCHPNAGLFAALSIAVIGIRTPYRASTAGVLAILAGMALVSAPWWLIALSRVGPFGILGAGSLDGPLAGLAFAGFHLLAFNLTAEMYLPWVGALGMLGLLSCLWRRQWMLPAWLILEILADQRLGLMFAMVPLAMLAAIGMTEVVIPGLPRGRPSRDHQPAPAALPMDRRAGWLLVLVLEVTTLSALSFDVSPTSPLHGLPPADVAAMRWVADNTPPTARFVVVAGDALGLEGTEEWFPALAERKALAVPQGTEWLGSGTWPARFQANTTLQACSGQTAACVEAWASANDAADAYVYLPKGQLRGPLSEPDCCLPLRETLRSARGASVVYDGPGATVFQLLPQK